MDKNPPVGSKDGQLEQGTEGRARASRVVQVLAAIVCHEPDVCALRKLVRELSGSPKITVFLIDNSETRSGGEAVSGVADECGAALIQNRRNLGVAEAQNIGIEKAKVLGCTHVLLLDQDSALDAINVDRMLAAFWLLRLSGRKIAALGPSVVDPQSKVPMDFVRLGRLRMKRLARTTEPVSCDMLISSGCLISVDALREIGLMDGGLFIDYVDMEWCTRARSAGYEVVGLPDVVMPHRIGERSVDLAGRSIFVHTPMRSYYLVRNALLFARKPYLTWRWRMHLLYRAAGHLVLFSLVAPQTGMRVVWMLRGLRDGVLGRGGRFGGPDGLGLAQRSLGRPHH